MTDEKVVIKPLLRLETRDGRIYRLLKVPYDVPGADGQPAKVSFMDEPIASRLCVRRIADERFETELGTQGGHIEVFVTQLKRPTSDAHPAYEDDPNGSHLLIKIPADLVLRTIQVFPSYEAYRDEYDASLDREENPEDDEEEEPEARPNGTQAQAQS